MIKHSIDDNGGLVIQELNDAGDVIGTRSISEGQIAAHCRDTDFMDAIPAKIKAKFSDEVAAAIAAEQ